MESTRIQNGQTERIEVLALDSSGNPVNSISNILLGIRRISDDQWLDFNDNTFKSSGWSSRQVIMAEFDTSNDLGKYRYTFNSSGFSDDTYQLRSDSTSASNFPQIGELKVGNFVDFLDTFISSSTGATPTQVNSEVQAVFDLAILGSPTADSPYERLTRIDDVIPSSFPGNFADLVISATTGRVDVRSLFSAVEITESAADLFLTRPLSFSESAAETNRCLHRAVVLAGVNRLFITNDVLHATKSNDTDDLFTATVSGANVNPIVSLDPS